ncbi:T9SS type A sorting domain-containing protein, partial [Empedobacter brevis]
NISWDQSVEHSLSQIHIVPFNGSNAIQIKFNPTNATANYDLTTYPKGIYFVEFILENGQRITKKIIKL